MAEQITVARPYAEAVFELAREQNALPVWAEMLQARERRCAATNACGLRSITRDWRSRRRNLSSLPSAATSSMPTAEVLSACCSKPTGSACCRKSGNCSTRSRMQPTALARAQIISAFPIDDAQLTGLKSALERHFGKKIEATVSIDPELIGGAKIVVGDKVIDASMQGELRAMANHLRT